MGLLDMQWALTMIAATTWHTATFLEIVQVASLLLPLADELDMLHPRLHPMLVHSQSLHWKKH